MSEAARILNLTPADVLGPERLPAAVSPDDAKWLTLCVYQEARGELQDGRAAVARVVLNRTRRKFCSDGSIRSTVFWPNQFSWTSWAFRAGHYFKVAVTPQEVEARAAQLYAQSVADKLVWAACEDAALDVLAGAYHGGEAYQKLGPDAVMYVNLAVCRPAWADPDKLVCQVGRHSFFTA